MPADNPKYKMTISLNVLNHLGINLYSNIPAVISEIVANSWDADAQNVRIDVSKEEGKITIEDDGHGMALDDINKKYLIVGYERRNEPNRGTTVGLQRKIMGRKGIGKLSLFSIANTVEVYSTTGEEIHGLRMDTAGIKKAIEENNGDYHPENIEIAEIDMEVGTRVVLTDLKKRLTGTERFLKKRIARRFSIIGARHKFRVLVDGEEVTVADRDYFHKLQYVWVYGDGGALDDETLAKQDIDNDRIAKRPNQIPVEIEGQINRFEVTGWIGSVRDSGSLKDGPGNESLNRITIAVRGKIANENILDDLGESGVYSKYIIGEINADFLDLDELKDIATSSRQDIIRDDVRFIQLRAFITNELKNIQGIWTKWRNEDGEKVVTEIPVVKEWYRSLKGDTKRQAKSLFGKINSLTIDSDSTRNELLKYGILAFEKLRLQENLSALDDLVSGDVEKFLQLFGRADEIEAVHYHQITEQRIKVIEALNRCVTDNEKEKVIQKHLFDHLWLLDPSWERATETPSMEESVATAFKEVDARLTEEEKKGRIDIRYKKASGVHVIVELKRANRRVSSTELQGQVDKYYLALRKVIRESTGRNEPIRVVCVVGRPLTDWDDDERRSEIEESLDKRRIRVVLYQELIQDAYNSYKAYVDKSRYVGRLLKLLDRMEDELGVSEAA